MGHGNRTIHLMVLVHGIMGNHKELGYVKEALEQELLAAVSPDEGDSFLVHAASSNNHNTLDGIEAGGRRLASEINQLLNDLSQQTSEMPTIISLSILGNSLGGLYARYALAHIDWTLSGHDERETVSTVASVAIIPNLFVTTATPHLGIRDMMYWRVPRFVHSAGAWYMRRSGSDLFRCTDVVGQMCLNEEFLRPLAHFNKRIAYANAFSTDAAVSTSTAAFLSDASDVLHSLVENATDETDEDALHVNSTFPTVRFQTECSFTNSRKEDSIGAGTKSNDDVASYSKSLDSLGWTKVFVDVRSHIAALRKRGHRKQDWDRIIQHPKYTSAELKNHMSTFDWNTLPFGHSFLVASAKNPIYTWFYSGGRPLVDRIAKELVEEMLGD